MKISVSKEDIEKGQPREACNCPIVLAIRRQFAGLGKDVFTIIDDHFIYVFDNADDTLLIKTKTPSSARKFIVKFDKSDRSTCRPFDFELPVNNA